jgi:hypothetical protein
MKRITLTVLGMLLIISVQADPLKGRFYLGGSLGFKSYNNKLKPDVGSELDAQKQLSWNVSPEFGLFLTDRFSIGIAPGFSAYNQEYNYTNDGKSIYKGMNYGVGVNGRLYFPISENFRIFPGLDLRFAPGKSETTYQSSGFPTDKQTTTSITYAANANLGIAWNVTDKIMIFGKYGFLGYSLQKAKNDSSTSGKSENTVNDIGFNVNTLGNPFNVGMFFLMR